MGQTPSQSHRIKNNCTHGKVMSQRILMIIIKAPALTVQKLLAKLKFSKMDQTPRSRSHSKIIVVPSERSYHSLFKSDKQG